MTRFETLAEIDEEIAKAEHLRTIAIECGFKEVAAEIERDLGDSKIWRGIIAAAFCKGLADRNPGAAGAA